MGLFRDEEEVREAYLNYIVSDSEVSNLEDATYQQEVFCDDISEQITSWEESIRKTKLEKFKISFYYMLVIPPLIWEIPKVEALEGEILSMEFCIDICKTFYSLQSDFLQELTSDNYQEISRLGDFCNQVFVDTIRRAGLSVDAIYDNINQGSEDMYHPSFVSDIEQSTNLVWDFCTHKAECYINDLDNQKTKIKK